MNDTYLAMLAGLDNAKLVEAMREQTTMQRGKTLQRLGENPFVVLPGNKRVDLLGRILSLGEQYPDILSDIVLSSAENILSIQVLGKSPMYAIVTKTDGTRLFAESQASLAEDRLLSAEAYEHLYQERPSATLTRHRDEHIQRLDTAIRLLGCRPVSVQINGNGPKGPVVATIRAYSLEQVIGWVREHQIQVTNLPALEALFATSE